MKVIGTIMFTMLVVLASQVRSHEEGEERSTSAATKADLPRFSELNDRARELLRNESRAKTESQRVLETLKMIDLANSLRGDPRYETSPTLQQTRGRLTARLRTVKKRTLTVGRGSPRQPKKIEISKTALAQLNAAFNARGAGANANQANNRGGGVNFGPMLVALIQDTISPSSWDVNGGSSTIRYWRPGMALVVRAPQGLHEQVRPLLGQLRRN